jgi:hypothetical protein
MKEWLFVRNSILYEDIIIYYTNHKIKIKIRIIDHIRSYKRQADLRRKLCVIIKIEMIFSRRLYNCLRIKMMR